MQLHNFFNSSTSYRVRIALALKGLSYDYLPVNLRLGEQRESVFIDEINPAAAVPVLTDGRFRLGQSLAIIDYLEAHHPQPPLLPIESQARARVLELSYLMACDMHPLNNLRVLRYLQDVLELTQSQKDAWYRHWIEQGMTAAERLLALHGHGPWCFGAQPTLADCCLIPQMANALRMGCDLSAYPRSLAIYQHALKDPAFERARPEAQVDFIAPPR